MEWLVCAVGRRCLWDVGWREWNTLVDRCGLFFTVSSGCSVVKGLGGEEVIKRAGVIVR